MHLAGFRIRRGHIAALALLGAMFFAILPGLVVAQEDTPAPDCFSAPSVVCPAADDPSAQYIASVTAVPDGVVLLLTDAGLEKALTCGGAAEIAAMAETLYAAIPADRKSDFQLDWSSQALADEIYGHAFFYDLAGGAGALGAIRERSNPINIVFADYGGPGQMTVDARAEQATFATLGTLHRAGC